MATPHYIEFRKTTTLNLENGGTTTTCQVRIGNQTTAQVRCYVIYANDQYIEVADLAVPEGKLRGVPCSCFMFIDSLG